MNKLCNRHFLLLCALLLPVTAIAADSGTGLVIGGHGGSLIDRDGRSVRLNDDGAIFKVKDLPDAVAHNDGSVTIDDKALELSAAQRAEVSDYVTHLRVLKDDAMEVGLHAAHFAASTLWDATVGLLLHGKNEEKDIDAKADKFAADVAVKICKPIGTLHDEGLRLATDVTQLKPYLPLVEDHDACIKKARSNVAASNRPA